MLIDVQVGDVVMLRKPHPCGQNAWEVVRIGADIGLRCRGCAHKVLLPRGDFNKRFKKFLSRAAEAGGAAVPPAG